MGAGSSAQYHGAPLVHLSMRLGKPMVVVTIK